MLLKNQQILTFIIAFKWAFEIPLNIILLSQINMSNLNNLFPRNASSAYCLSSPFSSAFGPNPFITLPYSSFPLFHPQSPYNYLFPQNYYISSNPQSSSLPTLPISSEKLENTNQSRKEQISIKAKAIQKNKKIQAIIEISDDEEEHPIVKGVQDKPTSSLTKIGDNTPLSSTNNKQEIQKQKYHQKITNIIKPSTLKSIPKILSDDKPKPQQAIIQKNKKVKPIAKPPQPEIKKQHGINLRVKIPKNKGKSSFRLSRRQKQLLQVGRLRDHRKQIMTGPQFQAKLPLFHSPNFKQKLQSIRYNLLHRQYQEDEQ